MSSRSLLLYVPGMPFRVDALIPQHALASMAGCLLATEHETTILDYGTVEGIRRFTSPGLTMAAHQAAPVWEWHPLQPPASSLQPPMSFFQAHGLDALFHESQARRRREIASDVAAAGPLDFIVFLVNEREDLREALEVGQRLRKRVPEVRQVVSGPYIDVYGNVVLASDNTFDCACLSDVEAALPALADRITQPERWPEVRNLLYCEGSQLRRTPRDFSTALDGLPAPLYDKNVYPAVHEGGKLKLFMLEHSRGGHHVTCAQPETCWNARQARVKSPARLCGEMIDLGKLAGARTFHLHGAATPPAQVDRLAREIRMRCPGVQYSRCAHVHHLDPAAAALLAASGCRALGFQIDTGSQRLLADFYGHEFGVTQIERVLCATRNAGLFTVTQLTYPCPQDDCHTRAETIRVLSRCKPSAAPVYVPAVAPGSTWMRSAPEFGYRVDHAGYAQWVLARDTMQSWREQSIAHVPYRMAGWSRGRMIAEHSALVRDIEELGILTSASEREGLLARVAGYEGEEGMFCAMLHRRLFCADVKGLIKLVGEFNSRATAPVNMVAFRPFTQVLAAVGN